MGEILWFMLQSIFNSFTGVASVNSKYSSTMIPSLKYMILYPIRTAPQLNMISHLLLPLTQRFKKKSCTKDVFGRRVQYSRAIYSPTCNSQSEESPLSIQNFAVSELLDEESDSVLSILPLNPSQQKHKNWMYKLTHCSTPEPGTLP